MARRLKRGAAGELVIRKQSLKFSGIIGRSGNDRNPGRGAFFQEV